LHNDDVEIVKNNENYFKLNYEILCYGRVIHVSISPVIAY